MEQKILKSLLDRLHPMAGHSWLLGLDENNCKQSAKEITTHMIEFIEWLLQNTEAFPYSTGYYIIGSGLPYMSCEDIYKYWLDNIKGK